MPSRRQIREAAVQFLYCADLEGGANAVEYRNTFWELLTESDRRRLLNSTFRALDHITQGRTDRLLELSERTPTAFARLTASTDTTFLKKELQDILNYESLWSVQWEQLKKLPLSDVENETVTSQLDSNLKKLYAIDRDLSAARVRFQNGLDDFPVLRPLLEPITASLRRMQRISDRVNMLENPQQFPEQTDLKHLRDSQSDLSELRTEADQMVDAVLTHKESIDKSLAEIIENFAPERIDPVDRAILRLSACELLTRPDINAKIVINEAIDLAKKFGSNDSGRFVNGVLDQLAKVKAS
jgi:N utilization substance protein B